MAHDPYVREADWQRVLKAQTPSAESRIVVPLTNDLWAALEGADCAALVTKHREYTSLDLARVRDVMRTPALVDGRDVFDLVRCSEANLVVRAVGKDSSK